MLSTEEMVIELRRMAALNASKKRDHNDYSQYLLFMDAAARIEELQKKSDEFFNDNEELSDKLLSAADTFNRMMPVLEEAKDTLSKLKRERAKIAGIVEDVLSPAAIMPIEGIQKIRDILNETK